MHCLAFFHTTVGATGWATPDEWLRKMQASEALDTMRPKDVLQMSDRIRVSLFSSYWFGLFLLDELVNGACSESASVVGVATDDPRLAHCNAENRFWSRVPESERSPSMVVDLASENGIDVYTGRVDEAVFQTRYESWKPDLFVMLGFGQEVPESIFSIAPLGSYNFHPGRVGVWPSCKGVAPYSDMLSAGDTHFSVHCHHVTAELDAGPQRLESDPVPIPPGSSFMDLLKLTCPAAVLLLRRFIQECHR